MAQRTLVTEDRDMRVSDEETVYRSRLASSLATPPEPLRLVDLFSGAGGLSAGFSPFVGHAFVPVWANDFEPNAARTYRRNFGPHCDSREISSLLAGPDFVVPSADVVVGGPPCQGFSLLNRNRRTDPRKALWRQFLAAVERSSASVFVMENVPQLLGSAEHERIVDTASQMGYRLAWAKLCAADYGVPQRRHRAFILGCRFADPSTVFLPPEGAPHGSPDGIRRDA